MDKLQNTDLAVDEEAKLLLIAEDMNIEYDGTFPNLCSGELIVKLGSKVWKMYHVLSSGGGVSFDSNWNENVTSGEWSIRTSDLPKDFPENLVEKLEELVNDKIRQGCCGGCI